MVKHPPSIKPYFDELRESFKQIEEAYDWYLAIIRSPQRTIQFMLERADEADAELMAVEGVHSAFIDEFKRGLNIALNAIENASTFGTVPVVKQCDTPAS